jgi:hypothetical protein
MSWWKKLLMFLGELLIRGAKGKAEDALDKKE